MQLLFSYRTGDAGFMPGFVPIVAIYIPIAIYRTYLNQLLQIRWRRWLTDHLLTDWLSDRAYYTISLTADPAGLGTDNPDQRIADDLRKYVEDTLRLGLGLLSNVVSLFNFALILWTLSGAVIRFSASRIPGYMLWAALVYLRRHRHACSPHYVGRPAGHALIVSTSSGWRRISATPWSGCGRTTEGVALYSGERAERAAVPAWTVSPPFSWATGFRPSCSRTKTG